MLFDKTRRSRQEKTALGWLLSTLMAALVCVVPGAAGAQVIAGTSVYVRTDTDKTTVIAPRLHVGAPVSERARLDLVYTTDVWTSASVDIRASASKPVTEQRDEINTTLTQEWDDISLSGTYRYSHEYDYVSHGGSLTGAYSFADNAATVDVRLSAGFDAAGRAGDPNFDRSVRNLAARLGFTQVLDANSYVQVLYEVMNAHGFNASAYRYISLGSSDGLCGKSSMSTESTAFCLPETLPDDRLRHALAANYRRAFSETFSVGAGYRFYLDSWELQSHTGLLELGFSPEKELLFALRYRFYTQGNAKHYRRRYDSSAIDRKFYTNDKELSALMSHRVALDIEKGFELDERGHVLTLVLSLAPSLFLYSNYAPLTQILAFETTLAAVMKL